MKEVEALLKEDGVKTAIIAPSFAAEFTDFEDYKKLVGMIRALGFDQVMEVAFGADLETAAYTELFGHSTDYSYIAANCPAIVHYIRQYHPDLTEHIAKIASPAVVTARVARKSPAKRSDRVHRVPVLQKTESGELDEVITFSELREMFANHNLQQDSTEATPFDPPLGGQRSHLCHQPGDDPERRPARRCDPGNIVVAEGKNNYPEALVELKKGCCTVSTSSCWHAKGVSWGRATLPPENPIRAETASAATCI
ncbi:MAG: hypothetical protein M0C28_41355 [Candidatus Moduliflexus flocculans]|nr:hypothetical protein [Candidatus Moduliflexus flocculans]